MADFVLPITLSSATFADSYSVCWDPPPSPDTKTDKQTEMLRKGVKLMQMFIIPYFYVCSGSQHTVTSVQIYFERIHCIYLLSVH